MKKDKQSYLIDKCEKVDSCMAKNDFKGAHEVISSMTKKKTQSRLRVINDENGETLTESRDILNRWKQYCDKDVRLHRSDFG